MLPIILNTIKKGAVILAENLVKKKLEAENNNNNNNNKNNKNKDNK